MKKIVTLLLLLLFSGTTVLVAHPVNTATARQAGMHFMAQKMGISSPELTLLTTYGSESQPAIYVFDVNNGQGFILLAADDIIQPVLAYSTKNAFTGSNPNPALDYWLTGYESQITAAVDAAIKATPEVTRQWQELLTGNGSNHTYRPTSVAPLLSTTWDQAPYYNKLCPGGAPAGCVATAMGQIMKYWGSPAKGTGSHTYSSSTLGGTLSADFGNTNYDWTNMPNALTAHSSQSQVHEVAELLFDCGVAVEMDYSLSGSGSQVISFGPGMPSAETALVQYFGYSTLIHGEQRKNYDDATWLKMLKDEIDNGRPVLYAGFGNGVGHAFDFDGYDNSDRFHINWGWSGYGNGYYTVDNLQPTFVGTGGGMGNFNNGQQALMGITSGVFEISLNSQPSLSDNTLLYNMPFQISANIKNTGNVNFERGTLFLVAEDTSGKIAPITLDAHTAFLAAHDDYNYQVASTGLPQLKPGTYRLVYKYARAGSDARQNILDGVAINGETLLTVAYPKGIGAGQDDSRIVFFPNPAQTFLNLFWNNGSDNVKSIRLVSSTGRTVFQTTQTASGNLKIPVAEFTNGVYFLVFEKSGEQESHKVVIRK